MKLLLPLLALVLLGAGCMSLDADTKKEIEDCFKAGAEPIFSGWEVYQYCKFPLQE